MRKFWFFFLFVRLFFLDFCGIFYEVLGLCYFLFVIICYIDYFLFFVNLFIIIVKMVKFLLEILVIFVFFSGWWSRFICLGLIFWVEERREVVARVVVIRSLVLVVFFGIQLVLLFFLLSLLFVFLQGFQLLVFCFWFLGFFDVNCLRYF